MIFSKAALRTLLIAMVPVVELRGAIPVGLAGGLDYWEALVLAIIGNVLPVPFIILFAQRLLKWLSKTFTFMRKFTDFVQNRAVAKAKNIGKFQFLGIMLFVGIPLPGTGAWTGTLAGSILDMKFKDVVKACMGGVLLAGIIMGLASVGLLGALSTLFSVG